MANTPYSAQIASGLLKESYGDEIRKQMNRQVFFGPENAGMRNIIGGQIRVPILAPPPGLYLVPPRPSRQQNQRAKAARREAARAAGKPAKRPYRQRHSRKRP